MEKHEQFPNSRPKLTFGEQLGSPPPEIIDLIERERQAPIEIGIDKSLRAKITDLCGMACIFCHNEGTPVRQAHSDRVSIFEAVNGVSFMPGEMADDNSLRTTLETLKSELQLDELHLTGGEPTLNRNIERIIQTATDIGYQVKLTTNGETGAAGMQKCIEAGISSVNFSIFGATPEEYSAIQAGRASSPQRAAHTFNMLNQAIDAALSHPDIKVSANVVVPDAAHIERTLKILDRYSDQVDIRLLNDLSRGEESIIAIYQLLAGISAEPQKIVINAGASGLRTVFSAQGKSVSFKQIRRVILPKTCANCTQKDDCEEGFYGPRLYVDDHNNYLVGLCIERMDLATPVDEFIASSIPQEIITLRNQEYQKLTKLYERNQP